MRLGLDSRWLELASRWLSAENSLTLLLDEGARVEEDPRESLMCMQTARMLKVRGHQTRICDSVNLLNTGNG